MGVILRITFLAPAEVNDTLTFKYYALFPDTGTEFTRSMTFKTLRAFPGECTIGTDATEQAIKYFEAFNLDYAGPDFTATIESNVVTITCLNGSDIFDPLLNVGADFATFEEVATTSDNRIHEIIFTPRQYAVPAMLARDYLITEDDYFIITEDNKKIRL